MYWQVAQGKSNFIQENIDNAVAQETIQTDIIEKSGKILNPRTIDKDGNIVYVPIDDWCSGFFPGNIWHMYELTGDQKWLQRSIPRIWIRYNTLPGTMMWAL